MQRPAFSTANLVSPTLAKTTFVPDGVGAYVVTLTVFDGKSSSAVATTTVTASASNLTVNSTSYADGGSTPQGIARSNILFPQLSISDIPIGTKTLAITMVDEAQPCTAGLSFCRYWAVFNIPFSKATIAEGENLLVQSKVVIASNYPENIGYSGSALTPGARGGQHTYRLTVYALTNNFTLALGAPTYSVNSLDYGSLVVGKVTLTGTFNFP